MTFTSHNDKDNKKHTSLGLKLCALASVGVLAATGLSACSDNDDASSGKSGGVKASDFDGDMTLDDAYNIYDTAYKEGDVDQWCYIQTASLEYKDYEGSNIRYLVPDPSPIDSDLVEDKSRESCAHAIKVADKRNQETGEAYVSMKFSLLNKHINNTDYVKKMAKKVYPDADIDLAFEELHEDKDNVFERVEEEAFNKAADLYRSYVTPARLDEALRTNADDIYTDTIAVAPGFYPYELSVDQYREAFKKADVDMSDFAAYVIESDMGLRADLDEEASEKANKNIYFDEPPVEFVDRLVDEFKFTESEARSGAQYARDFVVTHEGRQPILLKPYLFSEYVHGSDHKPVIYNLPNGEKAEFTEDVYNKANVVDDLEYWKSGYLPAGVTIRESQEYSDEQIDQWQEDGTPLE